MTKRYITPKYYRAVYKGVLIEDDEMLKALINRACDLVDELTGNRLQGGLDVYFRNAADLNNAVRQVKKAVACTVEHLYLNGGLAAVSGGERGSIKLGSFSYSAPYRDRNRGGIGAVGLDARFARSVYGYLAGAGLLYRGLAVC